MQFLKLHLLLLFTLMLLIPPGRAQAQWTTNGALNTQVSFDSSSKSAPAIVSDERGGVIISWLFVNPNGSFMQVQRLDSYGNRLWGTYGVNLTGSAQVQVLAPPALASDGKGGAYISWVDNAAPAGLYIQHVTSGGFSTWGSPGLLVAPAGAQPGGVQLLADGRGGAYVAWSALNSGYFDIYGQDVDTLSHLLWGAGAKVLVAKAYNQDSPRLTSDGSGGVLLICTDRGQQSNDKILVAQRVKADGSLVGPAAGRAVDPNSTKEEFASIVSDAGGGMFVTWMDHRRGTEDIYLANVGYSLTSNWSIPVCATTVNTYYPSVASNGKGGVYVGWADSRTGVSMGYMQQCDAYGDIEWVSNGMAVTPSTDKIDNVSLLADGSGNCIITSQVETSLGIAITSMQKLSPGASGIWSLTGVRVATSTADHFLASSVTDGRGGAITVWWDDRDYYESYCQIYAQRVDAFGYLGNTEPHITRVKDVPNDQGGKVNVLWTPSAIDQNPNVVVTHYALYRGVAGPSLPPTAQIVQPGEYEKLLKHDDRTVQSGAKNLWFPLPKSPNSTEIIYWQDIGGIGAEWLPAYSYLADTPGDSVGNINPKYYFMVRAGGQYNSQYWSSNIDSGYSVDNLPPSPVQGVTVTPTQGPVQGRASRTISSTSYKIRWSIDPTETDIASYEIFRSVDQGFTPSPATRIAQTTNSEFTDSPVGNGPWFYRVTATDLHGNIGVPSDAAEPRVLTSAQLSIQPKWNLVSVPVEATDFAKAILFPTAGSNAYTYQSTYITADKLESGVGYWLKYGATQTVGISGYPVTKATVSLHAGWNMIGSISHSIATSLLRTEPAGIVISSYYSYGNGYSGSQTIEPGKGYWVKASAAGTLTISVSATPGPVAGRNPNGAPDELPPPPPESDPTTGTTVPASFALAQNYPNPFNPSTTIAFDLPEDATGSLDVYNIAGQRVVSLVDPGATLTAGHRTVTFDASSLPSGVYYYRLSVVSVSDPSQRFHESKSMLLVK